MLEAQLRDYYAKNLSLIDKRLKLIGVEETFPGGRFDILARKGRKSIGIELKVKQYNTNVVCAQLRKYLNYADEVYFIAPKVKVGVHAGLQQHENRLQYFEFQENLRPKLILPKDLDDKRPWPQISEQKSKVLLQKIVQIGIEHYVPPTYRKILLHFTKFL